MERYVFPLYLKRQGGHGTTLSARMTPVFMRTMENYTSCNPSENVTVNDDCLHSNDMKVRILGELA